MMPIILKVKILLFSLMFILVSTSAFSAQTLVIGPKEAAIQGSIKYSVIGKYVAEFDKYSGEVQFDNNTEKIQAVDLKIDAASISSSCVWCDKAVRSKQLLSVEEFPFIEFFGNEIVPVEEGYQVKGMMSLHGEKKEMIFPFKMNLTTEGANGETLLNIQGQWVINRKDFNITWNRLLDKGGILVGNSFTVDWEINLPIRK